SVINYKGGVGKTTLTANLGAYAAMKGYRVLMIDLDPQTHLTFSFMTPEEWGEKYKDTKTIKKYFDGFINKSVIDTSLSALVVPLEVPQCPKFDIICSTLEMADIDMKMAGKCTGQDDELVAGNTLMTYNCLRNGIEELLGEYDLILMDCPPNCNAIVRNALTASDYYLVPARLDYLSSLGIMGLSENVNIFLTKYRKYNESRPELGYKAITVDMLGVVPMMVTITRGTKPQKVQALYLSMFRQRGYYVFQYVRANNEIFGNQLHDKKGNVVPAVLAHMRADNTKSRVMGEMRQLCEEFIKRLGI
ncbi:MAG: AAA family ATPase, partial [Synergistaceae bacterium]|nr:AAA family ATPase [Synergistaceae bacterium]